MRDISLHLMDIAQNSVKAGASEILVELSVKGEWLYLVIEDNGCGMDKEMVQKVFDPFTTSRTTRKVGLGLPLLNESSTMAEGEVTLTSEVGVGTKLKASFLVSHIDRIPLGEIGITMATLISSREDINYVVKLNTQSKDFTISTAEIKEALGEGISLNNAQIVDWIIEFINENIKNVFGGVLDEIIS